MSTMLLSQDDSRLRKDTRCDWREFRWRVLFPTDFGPAAQRAWPYALGLARALATELVILHVLELTATDYSDLAAMVGVDMIAESLRRAHEPGLERLRGEAVAAGVSVRTVTVVGRVRREIVRAAVREHAAVVVVGLRRRPVGAGPLAAQSVAGWVASHTPCSVWIVSSGPGPACGLPWRAGELQDRDYTVQGSPQCVRNLRTCT
jgi:nucleotide-binding universal stress UspA family protein